VDGEVVVERRRQWTAEQKAALVAEVEAEGGQVSVVARRHGVSASLLYNWRSAWETAAMAARSRHPRALACRIGDDTELNKFRRLHRRASRRHRRGLPCRSPVVQQARRNPVPAGNHRNLATLRLDLG